MVVIRFAAMIVDERSDLLGGNALRPGTPDSLRKYAWDYFALHAAQRMAGFQFFITLATALLGGYFLLRKTLGTEPIAAVIGLLLAVLAFVFAKLDARARALVKNGENALRALDELSLPASVNGGPHPLQLIARDDYEVERMPRSAHFSYTRCFQWVYVLFGMLGVYVALYSLLGL